MNSSLATQNREALLEAARRMPPARRLQAFAVHSRLLVKLKESGERFRQKSKRKAAR